jgi:hypothetical protein
VRVKSVRPPLILVALAALTSVSAQAPLKKAETPKTMRLYVFDCGMIWIEHDFVANAKSKKAPAFYD